MAINSPELITALDHILRKIQESDVHNPRRPNLETEFIDTFADYGEQLVLSIADPSSMQGAPKNATYESLAIMGAIVACWMEHLVKEGRHAA